MFNMWWWCDLSAMSVWLRLLHSGGVAWRPQWLDPHWQSEAISHGGNLSFHEMKVSLAFAHSVTINPHDKCPKNFLVNKNFISFDCIFCHFKPSLLADFIFLLVPFFFLLWFDDFLLHYACVFLFFVFMNVLCVFDLWLSCFFKYVNPLLYLLPLDW